MTKKELIGKKFQCKNITDETILPEIYTIAETTIPNSILIEWESRYTKGKIESVDYTEKEVIEYITDGSWVLID